MRRAGRFVALVVAGVAIGSSCFAQVPYNTGFFAHIDGRWMWLGGDRPENALVTDQRMTSGPGGQTMTALPDRLLALVDDLDGRGPLVWIHADDDPSHR